MTNVKLKLIFYVLRPLANVRYIYENNKIPPMEYFKKELDFFDEIISTIDINKNKEYENIDNEFIKIIDRMW